MRSYNEAMKGKDVALSWFYYPRARVRHDYAMPHQSRRDEQLMENASLRDRISDAGMERKDENG